MRLYYSFILFCLIFSIKTTAQVTFSGVMTDEQKNPINRARVLIYSQNHSQFAFTNQSGFFQIKFDSLKEGKFLAVASASTFENDSIYVVTTAQKSQYSINFSLKYRSKVIDEVVLEGSRKAVELKKDTVVYNTEHFIDGTEKNVEDLLKKLPGIKVNESGSIEFKGKTVVAVLLDGSNLFDSNYMTGTRSIDANAVDQVQAIENWSENPILKNLNAEPLVALNLKFKKDKLSFSSKLTTETDFVKRHNIGGYVMVMNDFIKTFETSNYNNVGYNKSPINFSTNSFSFEEYQNLKYQAPSIIKKSSIDTQLGLEKANRNQQWFTSSNSAVKISEKANLKISASAINDKILINNISENFYDIGGSVVSNKDENSIVKTPKYFSGQIDLKWHKSSKEFIEFSNAISSLSERNENNLISNSDVNYYTSSAFKNLFYKSEFIYTRRLNEKKALQIKAFYTFNEKPETFLILPSNFIDTNSYINNSFQTVSSKKNYLGLEAILYHMFSADNKLKSSIGFARRDFDLESVLERQGSETVNKNINHLEYITNSAYFDFNYSFKNDKWDISFNQNNHLFFQNLNGISMQSKILLLNTTKLSVLKFLFNKTSLLMNGEVNTKPVDERYLFANSILVSNRNTIVNQPSLQSQTHQSYFIGLVYNNSIKSQFKASLTTGFIKDNNIYGSKFLVDEYSESTLNYRIDRPTQSYNVNFNVEKFIPFISSRFNFRTTYALSEYYNNINNYDLTKVKYRSIQFNLIHQFAFKFPLRIKSVFDFQMLNSTSNVNSSMNKSFSMKNNVSYSFKKNIFVVNVVNEYYNPDFRQTKDFLFLNSTLDYKPNDSKLRYSFSCNNIFNQKSNFSRFIGDYSVSYENIELLPRVLLLGCSLEL